MMPHLPSRGQAFISDCIAIPDRHDQKSDGQWWLIQKWPEAAESGGKNNKSIYEHVTGGWLKVRKSFKIVENEECGWRKSLVVCSGVEFAFWMRVGPLASTIFGHNSRSII